jgi:hypothetical protein
MSKMLYKMINPPITLLLKSPIHSVISSNTLVVEFRGRRSRKTMTTPISYHHAEGDGSIHCFTAKANIWWRNLRGVESVRLLIKKQWITVTPEILEDGQETVALSLDAFLRAVPRDAAHSNVRLDANGAPNALDIQGAIGKLVLLKFRPLL